MTVAKHTGGHAYRVVSQSMVLQHGTITTLDAPFQLDNEQAGGQSATAPATATSGTIATVGLRVSRVSPAAAITGVILEAGTKAGQTVTVVNEAIAGNTVTFAAAATSNVADGTGSVIAGLTARTFVWDSVAARWFPSK